MNKIVVPTGYMGSGSSAITDFLSELDGFENLNGSFEYILLHCPDGVFDLEDKLLYSNNAIRSDEALHRFKECMKGLYSRKNFWAGMYIRNISQEFMSDVDEYINRILTATFDGLYWHYSQNPDNFILQFKHYFRRVVKKLTFGKVLLEMPLRYNKMMISFPNPEEFYSATKDFLKKIYEALGIETHHLVLDQLLLPHNLFRIDRYFDENIRVIVVDRDPRDVFVLNKYKWLRDNNAVPYPLDVKKFCDFYKRMRQSEKIIDDNRIMRIHFEDLVYHYDESVERMLSFLAVSKEQHIHRRQGFNPDISRKNTQLFFLNSQVEKECAVIEEELKEYIYNFPHVDFEKRNIENLF